MFRLRGQTAVICAIMWLFVFLFLAGNADAGIKRIYAHGVNSSGSLGLGFTSYSTVEGITLDTTGLTNPIKLLPTMSDFSAALNADGSLYWWGGGVTSFPTAVPGNFSDFKTIKVYWGYHTPVFYGIKNDGTLWRWDGTGTDSSIPVKIEGFSDVADFAVGSNFIVAIKSDKTVWLSGMKIYGCLIEYNPDRDKTDPERNRHLSWIVQYHCDTLPAPIQVTEIMGAKKVLAGSYFAIVLDEAGYVYMFGVPGIANMNHDYVFFNTVTRIDGFSGIVDIGFNSLCVYALKIDGTIWVWGPSFIKNNSKYSISTPVQLSAINNVKKIAVGSNAVVQKNDGSFYYWPSTTYIDDASKISSLSFFNSIKSVTDFVSGSSQVLLLADYPNIDSITITGPDDIPGGQPATYNVQAVASPTGDIPVEYKFTCPDGSIQTVTNSSSTASFTCSADQMGSPGRKKVSVTARLTELQELNLKSAEKNVLVYCPVTAEEIIGPSQTFTYKVENYSVNASSTCGTITYMWSNSKNATITDNNTNSSTVKFKSPGDNLLKVKISTVETPDKYVEKTLNVSVTNVPLPVISSVNCPQELFAGQTGTCTVAAQRPEGVPEDFTLTYEWAGKSIQFSSPETDSTDITPVTEGQQQITIKVGYDQITEMYASQTVNLNVPQTVIDGKLTCPEKAYKSQTIQCDLTYTSNRPDIDIKWLATGSIKSLSGDKTTAMIKILPNGKVTATIGVFGIFSIKKSFTADIFLEDPPKPTLDVTVSPDNNVYVGKSVDIAGKVNCAEGLTCLHEWYVGNDKQEETELSITKSFDAPSKKTIKLVAWVDGIDRELTQTERAVDIYVLDYPALYVFADVDKKYASVGETVTFTASTTGLREPLPTETQWTLPDGTVVNDATATYTVKETDSSSDKAQRVYASYKVYYRDYSLKQKTGRVIFYVRPQYKMPAFKINFYSPLEGPLPYSLYVTPKQQEAFVPGYTYNLTYQWEIPELNVISDKKYFVYDIAQAGDYTINLKVSDDQGNVVTDSATFKVTDPSPWKLDFKVYKSNKYSVVPLQVTVKPLLTEGHPKDIPISYSWTVGGNSIAGGSVLAYKFDAPGIYDVGVSINTKFGNVVTGSVPIEVLTNQPPVCDITYKTTPSTKTLTLQSACSDPDGRVTEYHWTINGGKELRGGSKISTKISEGGTVNVVLRVVDNGGDETTVQKEVTLPW